MSKSELACKLQGSAIGFVEVTRDLGFWKTASLSDKGKVKDSNDACFKVCVPFIPPSRNLFIGWHLYIPFMIPKNIC